MVQTQTAKSVDKTRRSNQLLG